MHRVTLTFLFLAVFGMTALVPTVDRPRMTQVTIFSAAEPRCSIVIPIDATPAERQAADTLQSTLAQASQQPRASFPVITETRARPDRALYLGATRRGADFLRPSHPPPYDTTVGLLVRDGAVFIRSERRDAIAAAAAWFLESHLGAHWFIPGRLGEVIPRRAEFTVEPGVRASRPAFIHRELGVQGENSKTWYDRNKLGERFEHTHNLANIFRPEDFRENPDMAPTRNGQKFIPVPTSSNWQPNLLSHAAVRHAAAVANRAFSADPRRLSFSLSINDTDLYDQSAATLDAIAGAPLPPARGDGPEARGQLAADHSLFPPPSPLPPSSAAPSASRRSPSSSAPFPHYFRHRPDYSPLVFGFTNAVAERVARFHPKRYLPAYAYYWCENAPPFPIARNVVPFLTADRSRWSFPDFAAEDQALIRRWCRSGADIVGVYDYLEGAPYLCPRPLLYAIGNSIPFEYQAGVRAFYGEGISNWALDGPKAWLTAQLLWEPGSAGNHERSADSRAMTVRADALLQTYYREFWAEAADPMRRFFEICEDVWQRQPPPPRWLRYYADEDQAYIYTAAERQELRRCLQAAEAAARTDATRDRVAFTSAAFEVTEKFAAFCAARADLSRKVTQMEIRNAQNAGSLSSAAPSQTARRLQPAGENTRIGPRSLTTDELVAAWHRYHDGRAAFVRSYDALQCCSPLALAPQNIDLYLRNEPDSRVTRALLRTAGGRAALVANEYLAEMWPGATASQLARLFSGGVESLYDSEWRQAVAAPIEPSISRDWGGAGAGWRGTGEAWEGRAVEFIDDNELASGRPNPAHDTPAVQAGTPRPQPRVLRFVNCRTESFSQWVPAVPNALYVGQVHVRAKSSPGTATFLIVNFLDENNHHLGLGRVDRLPADRSAIQETDLCVVVRAPPEAKYIGFAVQAWNQIDGDFAEFSSASLKQSPP